MAFLAPAAAGAGAAGTGAAAAGAGSGMLAGTSAAGLGSMMGAGGAAAGAGSTIGAGMAAGSSLGAAGGMAAAPTLSSAAVMNSAAASMGPTMGSGVNIFEAAKTAGMNMLDKNPMMSFISGNAKPQEMAGSGLDRFAAGFSKGDTGTALANFQSGNTSGGFGNLIGMSRDYNRQIQGSMQQEEELRRQRGY